MTLSTIEKNNCANPGGLIKLWVQRSSQISGMGIVVNGEVPSITLSSGSFAEIGFSPDSGGITIKEKETDSGTTFESTISLFLPLDEETTGDKVSDFQNARVIVIAKTVNGTQRILGSIASPARIRTSQQNKPGHNGWTITINWQSDHAPWYFTGTI